MKTDSKIWCGIDVSKKSFDAALVTDESVSELRNTSVRKFESTEGGVTACVSWLNDLCCQKEISLERVRIVMEATGAYSMRLARLFLACKAELAPAIVNPAHASYFQKSLGITSKTDAIDARALGLFGRERKPSAHEFPSKEILELRSLYRLRTQLVAERVANENRLAEIESKLAKRHLVKHIAIEKKRIQQIENDMAQIVDKSEDISKTEAVLRSIPGVGPLTALVVIAELGDLRRFNSARQLTSFVGLAPRLRESGTSLKRQAHLSRSGNASVRRIMYMAAMAAVRTKGSCFRQQYDRLIDRGKARKSAIMAIARKMLVVMRALIKADAVYRFPQEAVEDFVKI